MLLFLGGQLRYILFHVNLLFIMNKILFFYTVITPRRFRFIFPLPGETFLLITRLYIPICSLETFQWHGCFRLIIHSECQGEGEKKWCCKIPHGPKRKGRLLQRMWLHQEIQYESKLHVENDTDIAWGGPGRKKDEFLCNNNKKKVLKGKETGLWR